MKLISLLLLGCTTLNAEISHQTLSWYKEYFDDQDITTLSSGVTDKKRGTEIIVTLTSYPARIETTWMAIESLLRQSMKPDRVVLNLFEGEFPDHQLPESLQLQLTRGLEINWCPENHKVFLKAIPTIRKYPHADIVTIDDDEIYYKDLIKDLYAGHQEHPNAVIARAVRIVPNKDGIVPPASMWSFSAYDAKEKALGPASNLVPEGYQGVYYPAGIFQKGLDDLRYKELCPNEDDAWMYTLAIMNDKKIFKVPTLDWGYKLVPTSQDTDQTLNKTNENSKNFLGYSKKMKTLLESGLLESTGMKKLLFEKEFFEQQSSLSYSGLIMSTHPESFLSCPILFSDNCFLRYVGEVVEGNSFSFSFLPPKDSASTHVSLYGKSFIDWKDNTFKYLVLHVPTHKIIALKEITKNNPVFEFEALEGSGWQEYKIVSDIPFSLESRNISFVVQKAHFEALQ